MSLIIDGHNLIPKLPGMSLSMLDDEEKLINILVNYCRISRKQVTVFFDNAPPGMEMSKRFGALKVIFVKEGRSADSAIISMLSVLGKRAKNWSVVTSDRELQMRAKSLGSRVISSEDFTLVLLDGSSEKSETQDLKNENYPDEEEVRQWLEVFGEDSSQEL